MDLRIQKTLENKNANSLERVEDCEGISEEQAVDDKTPTPFIQDTIRSWLLWLEDWNLCTNIEWMAKLRNPR